MSFTRAGSTPSTANDVVFVRVALAKTMAFRLAWSRVVCTESSMVAFKASSMTTWRTRCIPPRRSRPRRILPAWPFQSMGGQMSTRQPRRKAP